MCIWTPLESWLPGQPLEIIYVCVYPLIYCSFAMDFSYGKENEKNAMLYWVYTGLYSVQISIYRYTTLYPSMKPVYLGIYAYEQVQDRIYAYERCISAYKSVYLRTSPYIRVYMRMWHFAKTCMTRRFELGISCILQGCSDHYATRVDTKGCIVWYMSAKLRFKFEPRCLLADVGRPVLSRQHPRASHDGWFRKAGFQV